MADDEFEQCRISTAQDVMSRLVMPIETAPRDGTHVLLLTSDFGWVEGWWDASVPNFAKSQKGWASHDPGNAQGDWVSYWQVGDDPDRRLYCGSTPHFWTPVPAPKGSLT